MVKSAREQMVELEAKYKSSKKELNAKVRVEEAKELSGLFDTTLASAVESLRASVTAGLGVYHRNLKAIVVRVSVDAKGVTSLKNTIRTIRMTPAEIKVWDESHIELSREDEADAMRNAITSSVTALDEYEEESVRLEAEAKAQESEELNVSDPTGPSAPEPVGAVA